MRKLITILFVIFCQVTFGQVYQLMPQYGYSAPRMNFDSTLTIPTTNGVPTLKSNITRKGAVAIDSTNGRFYFYNPKTLIWDTIKGGSGTASDTASVVKALVHNAEETTITKGSVVYLFGAAGNVASVKRAYNKSDTFSSKTFAIVKEDIAAGQRGTVITQGVVDKLNLGSYSEGDIIWLDSIAGQFTKVKPSAPYHQVFIGVVERANNGNGQLYVKVQNGYELGELHNVSVNGQANNDVLYYQSSTQLWKAKSPYLLVDTSGLSNRINVKLNASDTSSLSSRINTKLNSADTSSLSNRINTKLNLSDSTIYQTKFRSDSARTNTYTAIAGKFTLPSLTSGSILFSNGTTINQKNANLFWDNTNNRLGIGTNTPTTLVQLTTTNTDYTNTNGAGSHIYMTNASATGQNVVSSFINGSMVAKWRTDYVGNISWVAGSTGAHDFYTKGDFGTGQIQMRIFNGGNVQIASSSVGGGNSDAGYKLDVQGNFKSTGRLIGYTSKTGAYTATATDEYISADATSAAFQITLPTAVSKTGQTYTIKRINSGANAVTVGTTSSQTIDGSTTYSLSAQYKYVSVISNGSNWLIIANN
jgi:hypothetical protein